MRSLQGTALWAAGTLLFLIMVFGVGTAKAQQVWPGDINNNGVVNGVDLLYHGVAEGGSGPARTTIGTDWEAYDAASAWSGEFIDGLNFNRADVNGRGSVEQGDRNALWQKNYGQIHSPVLPDIFLAGDQNSDPVLDITAVDPEVDAGQLIELSLSLGSASKPITHFFGITFTINFDPNHIGDEVQMPMWNPDVLNIQLATGNWLNPDGNSVESFVQLDNAAGKLEVVIMRKTPGTVSGHGEIASVMASGIEDIVMLEGANTSFSINDIKLIDDNMVEYPVAGSTTTITIQPNASAALQASSETTEEISHKGRADSKEEAGNGQYDNSEKQVLVADAQEETVQVECVVYPNPVVNELTARLAASSQTIESVQLYNANGQLVRQQGHLQSREAQMDVSDLPNGSYILRVETSAGTVAKMISK